MINCHITRNATKLTAQGTITEITAETAMFLNSLYSSIDDPGLRDFFRITMTRMVTEEDSPLWKLKKGDRKFRTVKRPSRFPFFGRGRK